MGQVDRLGNICATECKQSDFCSLLVQPVWALLFRTAHGKMFHVKILKVSALITAESHNRSYNGTVQAISADKTKCTTDGKRTVFKQNVYFFII